MFQIRRVLVSDDIEEICLQILRENGIEVIVKTKLSIEQLIEEAKKVDALIVRSATKVTAAVIEQTKLKVIGRAGTGVDNIDVNAATKHGVIVMNTPMGNSRSACELTCSMIQALTRNISQADSSMKSGKWDRKNFMGSEVFGKTLAIIGLGNIGREVATRMQAFGMRTIGFDPLVSAEQSKLFGVEWMELEQIWPLADYITVHVPLIKPTENMINSTVLNQKCKRGVYLINCARGGIINESDLLEALQNGACAGAGLDVFTEEPPKSEVLLKLIANPKTICTPHLGASTIEAQNRVAEEIAWQFVWISRGEKLVGALNAAHLAAILDPAKQQLVKVAENLGIVASALLKDVKFNSVSIEIDNGQKQLENALKASCLVGLMKNNAENGLNLISAISMLKSCGIEFRTNFVGKPDFVTLTLEDGKKTLLTLTGCPSVVGTLLISIDGKNLEPRPLLLTGNCSFGKTENLTEMNANAGKWKIPNGNEKIDGENFINVNF